MPFDPDLTEEDIRILEEVWDEIGREKRQAKKPGLSQPSPNDSPAARNDFERDEE